MTTESGSVLTGTPAAAPAPAAGNPEAQTAAPAAWYAKPDIDQGAVAWAKGRGYNLDQMNEHALPAILGHYNAEKLIGLDRAGRTVAIPKDDAPAAEWDAYHAKLGRPESPKGYKLPDGLKDDPVATQFLEVAHKAGYTQKHIDQAFEFIGQQTEALQAKEEQEREVKAQQDVAALRSDWGQEFELRSEAARRAVRELGLSKEEALAIEKSLGVGRASKVFFEIGKSLLEDKAEGLRGGGAGAFGLSPTEARGRIDALKRDTEFSKKMLAGDAQAKAEWDRLHQVAYS